MPEYPRANPAKWWHTKAVGSAHRSPAAMFISPARRFSTILILTLLITLIAAFWYFTNPKRISQLTQVLLSGALGGDVRVRDGHLSFSGTLLLSDVSLNANAELNQPPIFHADQLEVRFDWFTLLSGQLRATQVVAFHPTLRLIEDQTTGRWNYESLIQNSPGTAPAHAVPPMTNVPFILLREARVEWDSLANGQLVGTASTTIDGQLAPEPQVPSVYRLQIDQRAAAGKTGTSVTGTWDVGNNRFTATTTPIDLARLDPGELPNQVRQWWKQHDLRGTVNAIRTTIEPQTGITLSVDLSRVSMIQDVPANITQNGIAKQLTITDVSGPLEFNITHGHLQIANLRGHVLGVDFSLNADFEGLAPDAPFDLSIDLPNADVGNPYPDLIESFPQTHDLIQRLRPTGHVDISANVKRTRWGGNIFTTADLFCHDMNARFCHFPYPLTHVNGALKFIDDHVEIADITALAGENLVHISGISGTSPDNRATDILVRVDDGYIDERVASCLPGNLIDTWKLFNPEGRVAIECHVVRPNQNIPPHVTVAVDTKDVSATYANFPFPMKHIHGKIIFNRDQTQIVGLSCVPADGSGGVIQYSGTVYTLQGDTTAVRPDVDLFAQDLTVNHTLIMSLPENYRRGADILNLKGKASLQGTIARGDAGIAIFTGNARLADASVHPKQLSWGATHLDASILLTADAITLQSATAQPESDPQGLLYLTGVLSTPGGGLHVDLGMDFQHIALPDQPVTGLPPQVTENWTHYHPTGRLTGNVDLVFDLPAPDPSAPTTTHTDPAELLKALRKYDVHLYPESLRLAPRDWPDTIDDITGEVAIDAQHIAIPELSARTGPLSFSAHGQIDRPTQAVTLALHATGKQLPSKWFSLLPKSGRDVLDTNKPTGSITLDLPILTRAAVTTEQPTPPWLFRGSVAVDQFKTIGDIPLTADHIALNGGGQWTTGQSPAFSAKLTSTKLTIADRPLDALETSITGDAQNSTLDFSNITAQIAGGRMEGSLNILFNDPPSYKTQLLLSGADLHALLLPAAKTESERQRIGTGTLAANLSVEQVFGADSTRTGRGEVQITDAKIFDVPLAMGLMQLVTLRLPVSHAFNALSSTYFLRDNKVTFEKILLESPNVNLAGLGTLRLQGLDLDLNFVTTSPNELQIPLVSDVIQTFRDQLLQVEVTGPVGNPHIQPVPLNAITTTLRNLLPTGRGK